MTREYPQQSQRLTVPDEPLWLQIRRGTKIKTYEFAPESDRVLVVGSTKNADIRICGAAPIAFYLERQDGDLWLTPGYTNDTLRLDAQRVEMRRCILGRATVDLFGVRLVLRVRDSPPTVPGDGRPLEDVVLSDPFSDDAGADSDRDARTALISHAALIEALRRDPTLDVATQPTPKAHLQSARTREVEALDVTRWFDATLPQRQEAAEDRGLSCEDWFSQLEPPVVPLLEDRNIRHAPTSIASALERLRLLTKREPFLVSCGAALGALVLTVCLLGFAYIAGAPKFRASPLVYAAQPVTTVPTATTAPSAASPEDTAVNTTLPDPAPASSNVTAERQGADDDQVAVAATSPDASTAAGRPFAHGPARQGAPAPRPTKHGRCRDDPRK